MKTHHDELLAGSRIESLQREIAQLEETANRQRLEIEGLHQEAKTFRSIAENANDAILVAQQDETHVFANQRAAEITGYQIEELLLLTIKQLSHRDEYPQLARFHEMRLRGEPLPKSYETRIVRKDGAVVPVEITPARICWRGAGANMVIIHDLTKRKMIEHSLEESRELFRLFADSAPAAVFIKDADSRTIYTNSYMQDMLGVKNVDGKLPDEIYPDEISLEMVETDRRALAEGSVHLIQQIPDSDGNQRTFHTNKFRIVREGQKSLIGGIGWDITQWVAAEKEVAQINAELESRIQERTAALKAANEELQAFSYSVSHDLLAPLRSINGCAAILLSDHAAALDADAHELLRKIMERTRSMAQLIDALLSFSQLTQKPLNYSEVALGELGREIFKELAAPASERAIEFKVVDPPTIMADRALIRQVLYNLLSNAVKFTRRNEQAVILFTGICESDRTIYCVQDNGVGFDNKHADKLFNVFQRLHDSNEYEGTGVGLAIVERIVRRHGGEVWAEGRPGQGATFYFTLPHRPVTTS